MSRVMRLGVRWPKLVIGGWLVIILLLALVGRGVEGKLLPTKLLVPGTETHRWDELRRGHFGADAAVLLRGPAAALDREGPVLARALARRPGTRAMSPWSGRGLGAERLRPTDRFALIVLDVDVPAGRPESSVIAPLERFVETQVRAPVTAHVSGMAPLGKEINQALVDSVRSAERLAFPALLLVLLLVFRTPIAAAIPLVIAVGTVAAATGIVSILAEHVSLDAVALSMASLVGLALGVDYSLLIVTRFREALEQGHSVRQAASLSAHTAGRTAVAAGSVVIAVMLVALILSPGTILLSASAGAIVVTALSMLGAALVTPSAVRVLGHRVNRWPLGARRRGGRGAIGRVVQRGTGRPALAAGVVLALLVPMAAAAVALDTIPPDPGQLPPSSEGRRNFAEVRTAGFGPSMDIAVTAPTGTLAAPQRLAALRSFERRLQRVHYVRFVVGPGTLADAGAGPPMSPRLTRVGNRLEREGRQLARLDTALGRAAVAVARLRRGLAAAAGGERRLEEGTELASAGMQRLGTGAARAAAGARRIAGGNTRAREGAARLMRALSATLVGGRRLGEGAARVRTASARIAGGTGRLRQGLRDRLAPGAQRLADALRAGQTDLRALREPAQVVDRELEASFRSLKAMTVGKADPQYDRALRAVGAGLAAATGRDPRTGDSVARGYRGLDPSLERAVEELGKAASGATAVAGGAREAARASTRLSSGSRRLGAGVAALERGNHRLRAALREIIARTRDAGHGLDRLAKGAAHLAGGITRLRAGTLALTGGLSRSHAGLAALASRLQSGVARTAPLDRGLRRLSRRVSALRVEVEGRRGGFQALAGLQRLRRRSPGFFESGFATIAALDGAPLLDRESARFLMDLDAGGSAGRVVVLPDVPTNDPRTAAVVDDVRDLARDFERTSGLRAAVGGAATALVEYDRVTAARLPLLVAAIAIATYLMLVGILRSLFLPLIAVALNLMTVAAAFGVLTLLFVGENPPLGGAGALDVVSVAAIFAVTFALSIDYQVFLLSRMREEFVRSQSSEAAIRRGVEKTAGVVTGAAMIMVAVFVAFALSDFGGVRQFGVGLATAVLIDATVVRLVLLPAVMRMFGLTTWWLPTWLDERLPILDIEGVEYERERERLLGAPMPPVGSVAARA